jgi:hypothetical protein
VSQFTTHSRITSAKTQRRFCKLLKILIAAAACLTLVSLANGAIQSCTYQTIAGATALERGDNVTNGSRSVSLTADLSFDLTGAQPSLSGVIYDAVLEGSSLYANTWTGGRPQPFQLAVHSSSGTQLADGSYRFTGDYLKDIYPSGTQYTFDWQFSAAPGGNLSWSGDSYWAGGTSGTNGFPALLSFQNQAR